MKITAKDRMSRLVAAIPWIAAQDGASIDEISQRFNYPRKTLLADLQEVVFFVGVPPYTPDTLIQVTIDDDLVWIEYADWFARPMRLSGAETLALLAAGEAALGFDNQDHAGALARGLTKLRLSTGSSDTVEVRLGSGPADRLPTLRTAADEQHCVDIGYYSYGRDTRTERRIEPSRFFVDAGTWYVGGYCHLAQEERVFRVDRIETIELTDELFSNEASKADEPTFSVADAPRATIEVSVDRERLFDGLPIDDRHIEGDRLEVVLPVLSQRWLTQMMIRLGPDAELRDSPGRIAIDVAHAADGILKRYV